MKVKISENEMTLGTYEVDEFSQEAFESIAMEKCQEGAEGIIIPFDIVEFTAHENSADFVISDGDEKYYFSAVRVD